MEAYGIQRAIDAARSTAMELGLIARDAVVIQDSNKLTLRLRPCDVLARVSPMADQSARFEVDVAQRLADLGSPVAALEAPQVFVRDDYIVTLWTYYEPVTTQAIPPAAYADALERLHAGMRKVELAAPRFTDRVSAAQTLVADHERTPDLADVDRAFLADTLARLRQTVSQSGRPEQLLHGEPHPGNLLSTDAGLLFIDFETCCLGPIEFDLAHAPVEVADHYPGVDHHLLRNCRILALAMATTWRWDRNDRFPDARRIGVEWLSEIRILMS